MKKGTAILLEPGAGEQEAVEAVKAKYADKIRSAQGWYGVAVVNIKGRDPAPGATASDPRTLLVKVVANGYEVYGLLGTVTDKVEVTTGKFKATKAK